MLLLILALSQGAWALAPGIAQNTVCILNFEGNANDSSGNAYNFTNTGSVTFNTSPAPIPQGLNNAGQFSDTKYFTAPAGTLTGLSTISTFTIQFYVYVDSLTSHPVLVRWADSGSNYLEILATGDAFWASAGDANLSSTVGDFVEDTWYHVAWVGSATSRTIYKNGVSIATVASGNAIGTLTNFELGRHVSFPTFFLNGYLDQFRVSNVAVTSFPTRDSTNSNRSMDLDEMLYFNLSKLFRPFLWKKVFRSPYIAPTSLFATTQNQRIEQARVIQQDIGQRDRRTPVVRLTATPTYTRGRLSATMTPVPPTATFSPTPGP